MGDDTKWSNSSDFKKSKGPTHMESMDPKYTQCGKRITASTKTAWTLSEVTCSFCRK